MNENGKRYVDATEEPLDLTSKAGNFVEGKLTASREVEFTDKKSGELVHSMRYTVVTTDGRTVGFWGTAMMNQAMKNVAVGSDVKITYLGQIIKTKRGKAHGWRVQVALAESNKAPF